VKTEKKATMHEEVAIFESELFDALSVKKMTLQNILNDKIDYKAMRIDNPDASAKEKNYWADMHGLKALARSVNKNLDVVYQHLFS
jgi:hypothetical protein